MMILSRQFVGLRNRPFSSKCRVICSPLALVMATATTYNYSSTLIPYEPPSWGRGLKGIPKHKLQLAQLDTPIHSWFTDLPDGFSIHIKRDDMTGSTMSGNKVRKLEFLMADAVKKDCDHVITCGGLQSNHCRAVAVAAAQLKMKSHLFFRTDIEDVNEVSCLGNVLLDRMCGASIYLTPPKAPYETELKPRMEMLAKKIKELTDKDSYHIPVGGSNAIGMYGYLSAFQELLNQRADEHFDDIVFACGSGGTAEGLCIGNYLTGSKFKIHAIAVCDDAAYFYHHINETLKAVGLTDVKSEDIIDVIDGHKGKGYGLSTQDELDFLVEVSTETGIFLDPVYTGKAVKGLFAEINNNPNRFKGKRILFIHTGGIFGLYDGRVDSTLTAGKEKITNAIHLWKDKSIIPADADLFPEIKNSNN